MVFTKVTKFQRIINYSVRKNLHNIDTAISLTIYAARMASCKNDFLRTLQEPNISKY